MSDINTHGHHESVLRSHAWCTAGNSAACLLGELRPGQRLLGAGCGPGTISLDLARRVAQSSFAVQARDYGLSHDDRELAAIAGAWRRWADAPGAVFIIPRVEILDRPGSP